MGSRVNVTADQQIAAAAYAEVEQVAALTEPRAVAVTYLPDRRGLRFDSRDGSTVIIPVDRLPLEIPPGTDLAVAFGAPEIQNDGEHVWWEPLEEMLTVPGAILHTLYGKDLWRAWSEGWGRKVEEAEARIRSEVARRAGATKSPAKSAAARLNGAKGGRPRKLPPAAGE